MAEDSEARCSENFDRIFTHLFLRDPDYGDLHSSIKRIANLDILVLSSSVCPEAPEGFLFHGAISFAASGGHSLYFGRSRLLRFPLQLLDSSVVPTVPTLQRMKLIYGASMRETVKEIGTLIASTHAPGSTLAVFIEDLEMFCRDMEMRREWDAKQSRAAVFSHFKELCEFAKSKKLPFQVVVSTRETEDLSDLVFRFGLCICRITDDSDRISVFSPQVPRSDSFSQCWYTFQITLEGIKSCL